MSESKPNQPDRLRRRTFLKAVATGAATGPLVLSHAEPRLRDNQQAYQTIDRFGRADSWYHGDEWESLNPGYWKIEGKRLRRRLRNYGDRARATGFPYHYETHNRNNGVMSVEYDPSLPHGALYRRDWNLTGEYALAMDFTVHALPTQQRPTDRKDWRMYQPGYGLAGLVFGAKSVFDSYGVSDGAWMVAWHDDGHLVLREGSGSKPRRTHRSEQRLVINAGEQATLRVSIEIQDAETVDCFAVVESDSGRLELRVQGIARAQLEGYTGIAGRGLLDFSVRHFRIAPEKNQRLSVATNECLNCYALGPTLQQKGDDWHVRFVALFRSDGESASIRIAGSPSPEGGWESVPIAGEATIVSNAFRRSTAVIEARLPGDPAKQTFYYTVWKDRKNVTNDPRIGSAACGPGTGFVGDVPDRGDYVGRLPKLEAPYKLCGLSCHAVHSGRAALPDANRGGAYFFRDQPTFNAYRDLEKYGFQVMLWEDDVWYLELMLYPPSTDDAYKVIANTICGPTTRWQMMRHWNVINPGDHDYGMDDVKGPEQLALRWRDGLGQDRDYMRRNFQVVQHLISGDERISPVSNPRKWRRWKMPNRDFSLLILDSRLWRSSQDTKIWDDEGWGHLNTLYDRADPTRSLLGEEQFAWLQEMIRTDSSKMICLTGLNGLHTVWTGRNFGKPPYPQFEQRDRVAADYAGWVKAGVDRVIELLSSREGIVSVYGDVHNGSIMKNLDHRLFECSFGPIGRSGGRRVIKGFGPRMEDYDGRPLEVFALYHSEHGTPDLQKRTGPYYWNFLEMAFDTRKPDPEFGLRIRNMVDGPGENPRGGGSVEEVASKTGRPMQSRLPDVRMNPNSDLLIATLEGRPVRGARTGPQGNPELSGLVDVAPGTKLLLISHGGGSAKAQIIETR